MRTKKCQLIIHKTNPTTHWISAQPCQGRHVPAVARVPGDSSQEISEVAGENLRPKGPGPSGANDPVRPIGPGSLGQAHWARPFGPVQWAGPIGPGPLMGWAPWARSLGRAPFGPAMGAALPAQTWTTKTKGKTKTKQLTLPRR